MVPTQQAAGQRSNQSSINQGIRKVIGSSNRGFASMDPERQRAIFGQEPAPQDSGGAHAVQVLQDGQGLGKGGTGSVKESTTTVQDSR